MISKLPNKKNKRNAFSKRHNICVTNETKEERPQAKERCIETERSEQKRTQNKRKQF